MLDEELHFYKKYIELKNLINNRPHNFHQTISIILRMFFAEGLAARIEKEHGVKVKFKLDETFEYISPETTNRKKSTVRFVPASWTGFKVMKSPIEPSIVGIGKFRTTKILTIENEEYTVNDVILFFANKAGGAHFDSDIDKRRYSKIIPFYQVNSISVTNALVVIANLAVEALEELSEKFTIFPDSTDFLFHFDKSPSVVIFEGNQFLENRKMNSNTAVSLLLCFRIQFLNQINNPKSVFFSMTGEDGLLIECGLENKKIFASVKREGVSLKCISTRVVNHEKLNVFISIDCFDNEQVIEVYVGEILFARSKIDRIILDSVFSEMTIGSNINGELGCAFTITELCGLVNTDIQKKRKKINSYFDVKYT